VHKTHKFEKKVIMTALLEWIAFIAQNSQAVKKSVALFKMASVKKVVRSKLAVKKWLCW